MFTTCAFTFAVGVYQALYEEMAQEAHSPFVGQSTARIGLIGTLAVALMSMGGPLVMCWAKLRSPRRLLLPEVGVVGWPWGSSSPGVASGAFIVKRRRLIYRLIILYGSFASAYISRFPASLIELFGVQYLTSVNGVLVPHSGDGSVDRDAVDWNADSSVTALVSSIVYDRVGIVCGVLLFAATLACVSVRIDATLGEVGRWKA
ncbi:hypothetical protein KXW75_000601 [Aspergillus fumigatus]|nr:hypothetical protein KXX64_000913 [Aspergillus fumigatus]KAH1744295.1 hypothetical protein KXX09_008932 [Aspergillus fumigatus]KAH2045750.1 hypothetical protein KXW51_007947 [Aspergillus fumigatus]KAH2104339.1 hypothetical protein KXW75_000601 [Aspergillus fumigatus]